jgi:hypothetical protein
VTLDHLPKTEEVVVETLQPKMAPAIQCHLLPVTIRLRDMVHLIRLFEEVDALVVVVAVEIMIQDLPII